MGLTAELNTVLQVSITLLDNLLQLRLIFQNNTLVV